MMRLRLQSVSAYSLVLLILALPIAQVSPASASRLIDMQANVTQTDPQEGREWSRTRDGLLDCRSQSFLSSSLWSLMHDSDSGDRGAFMGMLESLTQAVANNDPAILGPLGGLRGVK